MNFEEFRSHLEKELIDKIQFELQEYCYQPPSFGYGHLSYRIRGTNYKLTYDGREKQLIIEASEPHQKYLGADWHKVTTLDGLDNQIENVIRILGGDV
ncbi:hypothetical protein [Ekhidna sp.]|jgi:hypothetical protein|uniref:hypothetical protein n=1 Tax=Ekhidna sp. TaxID=2608089 RepID=UPI003BAD33B5